LRGFLQGIPVYGEQIGDDGDVLIILSEPGNNRTTLVKNVDWQGRIVTVGDQRDLRNAYKNTKDYQDFTTLFIDGVKKYVNGQNAYIGGTGRISNEAAREISGMTGWQTVNLLAETDLNPNEIGLNKQPDLNGRRFEVRMS
jgi:hypothetical protein